MPTTDSDTDHALNQKHLAILRLLYRFRFATPYHLSIALDIRQPTVNEHLRYLREYQYIGRHYDGQYRIHGRPAEYFLLRDGIRALRTYMPDRCDNGVLHSLHKDKNATAAFVAHSLDIFTVYCKLKECYGERLRFFTGTQIRPYDYFPEQPPDAFIRLEAGGEWLEYFLDVIDPNRPFFHYVGKIRRYIRYADDETWADATGTGFPAVLVVADTVRNAIRFQKQAKRLLKNHFADDPRLYTTSLDQLEARLPAYDQVWRDAEEPDGTLAMADIRATGG